MTTTAPRGAAPAGDAATTTIAPSRLWLAPLALGVTAALIVGPVALAARQPAFLALPLEGLLLFGGLALLLSFTAREVVVGPAGLAVRGTGERGATPLPWDQIAAIAEHRIRRRGSTFTELRVTRADGRVLVIAEYQVRSLRQVIRAIAAFRPVAPAGPTGR